MLRIKHDAAHYLPFGERDRVLLRGTWPNRSSLDSTWVKGARVRNPNRELEIESASSSEQPAVLRETILRFPSAPVFGTHKARQHAYKIEEKWPNFHTMRLLTPDGFSRASHVFLLHNGLNETRDISFHYRLASWILRDRTDAACIIRPLPGHLNRYFFQSPFTEPPLGEYLQDPASVFRQFLRHMLETQWLLSVLVPRPDYDIVTGCELLLYDQRPGRDDTVALGDEITHQANRALRASMQASGSRDQRGYSAQMLRRADVRECVKALRDLLGWSAVDAGSPPCEQSPEKPAIHAVGYSMGGFVAQSVFCTWPFAVASCSNLFAGGALRDLAPTAFAHEEEWQSVLHGLRSELDHARLTQHLRPAKMKSRGGEKVVVGIKQRTYEYFERVFEDVFLQSDRGSYSTRLAEFSRRLLFVLGGDDPIVQTRNVLDAAPPGGITLHQIGDVSHFQDSKNKEPVELEQRDFWLPEVGGMIGRFAERSAALLQRTNAKYWRTSSRSGVDADAVTAGQATGRKRQPDGGLGNMHFEHELDSMLSMVNSGGGWVFIARNQIPTVFLDDEAFRTHAAAMHHSEDLIGDYADALRARAMRLKELHGGFSLLLPSTQILGDAAGGELRSADTARDRAMFAKSEVAIRYWPDEESRRRVWGYFFDTWCKGGAVRSMMEGEYPAEMLGEVGKAWKKDHQDDAGLIAVTVVPDVWIALDRDACETLLEAELGEMSDEEGKAAMRENVEQGMVGLATKLARKGKNTAKKHLHELLATGAVRVIKVSAAEFNPRYRGRLLDGLSKETGGIDSLVIHWAMAYEVSTAIGPGAQS